jgi:enoyl-CoA hydratase
MLDIEEQSGVTVIRLRHGKVNALDLELLRAITTAVRGVDERRAVVITGSGAAFSAGVDLRRIVADGPAYVGEFLPALGETFQTIFDRPAPVVAAVNGHAIAGGCVIAAACDLRVMSQGTIGLAELSVGVPFPTSALEILRHVLGAAVSRMVLTASLLDPPQALAIGLIDFIERPEALLATAVGHAQRLARIPPAAFSLSKRQLQQPARARIAAHSDDDRAVAAAWSSDQTRQAIAEYLATIAGRPRS